MALGRKANIIVIGGTQRAVSTLKALLLRSDVTIPLAIIMPGHDDEKPDADELVAIAKAHGVQCRVTDRVTEDTIAQCRAADADAVLGIGIWRSPVPSEFLEVTRHGYLALHGTAVPAYRGWAGINWQIINGEPELRMRALKFDVGIDSGPLIRRENGELLEYSIDLRNEKHLSEVLDDYLDCHIQACNEIIDLIIDNTLSFTPQEAGEATYACHRGPTDGEIDWTLDTTRVFNLIRAQSRPYPGAFTFLKGRKVTLWRVRPRFDYKRYVGRIPGKVVTRDEEKGTVVILTGDGGIEVLEASLGDEATVAPVSIFNTVRQRCQTLVEAHVSSVAAK